MSKVKAIECRFATYSKSKEDADYTDYHLIKEIIHYEDGTIIVAAFKPDNENVVTFSVDDHRIFNGESWVKINDYEIIKYDGYGYDLTSKDGNFFVNSLLISN
jgi:intein/homing endonuclease